MSNKHLTLTVAILLVVGIVSAASAQTVPNPCTTYNSTPYTPPACPTVTQPWTVGETGTDNCGPGSPAKPYQPSVSSWLTVSATSGGSTTPFTVPGTSYSCCPTCPTPMPPKNTVANGYCTTTAFTQQNITISFNASG